MAPLTPQFIALAGIPERGELERSFPQNWGTGGDYKVFTQEVSWLMLHREGLDVLVHPETGDEVLDHTNHALWLGKKLDLNIEVLRQISCS